MIKLIGAVIVLGSLAVMGFIKALSLEKRLEILNEFEKSLVLLTGEIKYSAATLPEAVSSVGNRTNGYIKDFYNNVSKRVAGSPEIMFSKIWEEEIKNIFNVEMLDTEDAEIISELGAQLGHLDISMQLRSIELCIKRLNERQLDAAEIIKTKSKLYKTMGVAGGALITLVLL